jgi:hypothetical protein
MVASGLSAWKINKYAGITRRQAEVAIKADLEVWKAANAARDAAIRSGGAAALAAARQISTPPIQVNPAKPQEYVAVSTPQMPPRDANPSFDLPPALKIDAGGCRYPIGEPRTKGFRYCCMPIARLDDTGKALNPPHVYCRSHRLICYKPLTTQKEAA